MDSTTDVSETAVYCLDMDSHAFRREGLREGTRKRGRERQTCREKDETRKDDDDERSMKKKSRRAMHEETRRGHSGLY